MATRTKPTVSITLDKTVMDLLEANTDNKSQYINDILKAVLVNNLTQHRSLSALSDGTIDWDAVLSSGYDIEINKTGAVKARAISRMTGLGGDPIPTTNEAPTPKSLREKVRAVIEANHPKNWDEVQQLLPDEDLSSKAFQGHQQDINNGCYYKDKVISDLNIKVIGGRFYY